MRCVLIDSGIIRQSRNYKYLTDNMFKVVSYTRLGSLDNAVAKSMSREMSHFWKVRSFQERTRKCSPRISQAIMMVGLARYETVRIRLEPIVVEEKDALKRNTLEEFANLYKRNH